MASSTSRFTNREYGTGKKKLYWICDIQEEGRKNMKKKVILGIVGIIIVMSLITGRSKPGNDKELPDNSATETMSEAKEDVAENEPDTEIPEKVEEATTEKPLEEAVTPEFKELMDSYEKFFNEYVEFMKKYSDSDDTLGMMEEYTEYMKTYAETMEKLGEIDTDNLSAADYAYYVEVTARIQKKLLEVSGQ